MSKDRMENSRGLSTEERNQIRFLVRALGFILLGVFAASLIMVVVLSIFNTGV